MSDSSVKGLPLNEQFSYTSIRVLEFLYGLPWDDFAVNYVYGLRPSDVRLGTPYTCLDDLACLHRVTVMLTPDNRTILWIEQEVRVGTLGGFENGRALDKELKRRRPHRSMLPFMESVQPKEVPDDPGGKEA